MTFKVTVKNEQGELVNGLFVMVNDLMTGASYTRETNAGYADCAALNSQVGNHASLVVIDPELRYKGLVMGDALLITPEDQVLDLVVSPFV